jgi:sigma-B regulation protein RsbU (phosphoserine phosphatase)
LGGGLLVNRTRADLAPALRHAVDELKIAWPDRQIETVFDLHKPVDADPNRVAQLLSNLLANALTHGASDRPVWVRASEEDGAFELSVGNEGPPIPPAALERLFLPFTREDVRPSQQGLGLGLYIASEIAKAHEGTLSVTSSTAETRFTLRIPFAGAG